MFCRNCGTKLQDSFTYCRDCGEQVDVSVATSNITSWLRRFAYFLFGAGFGFLALFFIGAVLQNPFLSIWIFLIAAIILSGVTVTLSLELYKLRKLLPNEDKKRLPNLKETPKLTEGTEYIPASWSVTDLTTENLTLTKKKITGDL